MIGKKICTPIIFKINKKYTFTIYVGRVLVVIVFFLLEKQIFNWLSKVIGIQSDIIIFLSLQIRDRRKKKILQHKVLEFLFCVGNCPDFW